jgi:hypothetical protein
MNRTHLATLCLGFLLVLAGCLGGTAGPGTATQSTTTPSPADGDSTARSPTDSPSPADGMPAEPATLPSTADCLVDSVPSPAVTAGANDSLTGRSYPDSPDPTNASAVASYAAAFEEAYVFNARLADAPVEGSPLDRVTAQVTRTNVTRIQGGYLVVVDGLGATNYADGVHGDYGIHAVYRFTPEGIDRSRRVEPGERNFLPVVAC